MTFAIRYRIISIIVLVLNGYVGSNNSKSSSEKLLKTSFPIYLNRNYSKLVLPRTNIKEPVNITVVSKNLKIEQVDDKKWTITLSMRISFSWIDTRVMLHQNSSMWLWDGSRRYSILGEIWDSKLWTPDFDVVNLYDMKFVPGPNKERILKVDNDHRFWYEFPVTITINCPLFAFKSYPFDSQVCVVLLGSFKYPIQQNVYMGYLIHNTEDYDRNLQYDIDKVAALSFASCILTNNNYYLTKKGEMRSKEMHHSYFGIKIGLKRSIKIHIVARFMPSLLLVYLNWFAFAIDASNMNGRLMVHMISFLSILSISAEVHKSSPKCNELNALQIWMLGCLIFNLVAFSLSIVVLRLHQREQMLSKQKLKVYQSTQIDLRDDVIGISDSSHDNEGSFQKDIEMVLTDNNKRHYLNKRGQQNRRHVLDDDYHASAASQQRQNQLNSTKLDNILLWLFPLTFCIFLGAYLVLFALKHEI